MGQHHHGTELIRRTVGGEAFALTCPLITKADGGKFGKTESGNVWLDARYTSPYKFYQFWLNVSDADAEKYIKIFTSLTREEIEELVAAQSADPVSAPCRSVLPRKSPPWYTRLRNMRQPLKLLRFFSATMPPRLSTVSTRKLCCRCSKACPHLKWPSPTSKPHLACRPAR